MNRGKKAILILITTILLTGCSTTMKAISYQELTNLKKDKKTFILEVMQDGCSHCEEFTPRMESMTKKYKLDNVYQLNLSKLTKNEFNLFSKDLGITSTPTTCFFKDGKELGELYRLEGAVKTDLLIKKLKNLNYIK